MATPSDPGGGHLADGIPPTAEPPALHPAPADPTPPPLPYTPDPVARRLEAVERELRLLRRTTAGAPLWLVLAIALLLFCQALQFGLLIALMVRTLDTGEPPGPDGPAMLSDVAEPGGDPEDVAEPESPQDVPADPLEAASAEEPRPVARVGSSGTATVRVLGGDAYLVGKNGRSPPGAVPPGRYRVYAEAEKGTGFESLGRFSLAAGDTLTIRCGFGSCQASK
ncbi:MAG: hypothetical protein JXB39_02260 [Deltaproteobacteria bacterium]|nr:hypothetical protein [Deltaproteobacteria bacterium]